VEFIYISCIFDILLVGVKLNNFVMEHDFQRPLSCYHTPWVMDIFLV
jgi:hypothetical protein